MAFNVTSSPTRWIPFISPSISSIDLSPSTAQAWKPFYYHPHESLLPFMSDKYLALLGPIAVYWLCSLWFTLLDSMQWPIFEKYRLHEPEEVSKRNKVSASRVVLMVALQQAVQTMVGVFVLEDEETVRKQVFTDHGANMRNLGVYFAHIVCGTVGYKSGLQLLERYGTEAVQWLYWWGIPAVQFWWAFFIMDAWQYALHRAFHESRFLYRHFHSHHHRLYVPYAYGALYNHPLEGLLLDSAGGAISHAISLMTVRQGILLFTFSTLKTVCDHGGYAFPWYMDPLHLVFPNCAEYHDVHHQMQGLRYNYSQPFFVHFDVLFGTRMGVEKFEKMKEANKRIRDRERSSKTGQPLEDLPEQQQSSTTALASSDGESRRRTTRSATTAAAAASRAASEDEDLPASIVAKEGNPFVTTSIDSYRAKAGTTAE